MIKITFPDGSVREYNEGVQEDVSLIVNAPKLNIKINPEHLERILLHLLENAAEYTPAGAVGNGLCLEKRVSGSKVGAVLQLQRFI